MRQVVLMAGALALLAGCSSTPQIHIGLNPASSFTAYRTFAFVEDGAMSQSLNRYLTLVDGEFTSATRAELERRNYVYSERHPDLLVEVQVQAAALNIVVHDPHRNEPVWQGTLSSGKGPTAEIDESVRRLLAGFPLKTPAGDLRSSHAAGACVSAECR